MWLDNALFREDLDYLITLDYIPWERLQGSTVLVTGATGLIGYNLVCGLIYADIRKKLNMKIIALVRNLERAREKFSEQMRDCSSLELVSGDVQGDINITDKIDFIVHGASPTASRYFVENPVETIKISINGTINMLEIAKKNDVKGFVYLSSMEIYGAPQSEDLLTEKDVGYMNPLMVRNCYPESKRLCEALCASYADEYNVPAMTIRLAQTFGPGIEKNDARVFAEFARCVMERKDIVLLTDGRSKRCYLYTMDAVSAILAVLLRGKSGNAYNAANPDTYCSVKEMAQMIAHELADDEITVKYSGNKKNCKKFSPLHFYNLNIDAISELGWRTTWGLREMYIRMIHTTI